ncbi:MULTISPECIES: hypothetical protein [unclassified Oceanispirochaeta]|uniref:hypothetical protein n=1 Tax=unclassified Oceanispirochaeta TaxID=2635722 RepID=UPI000E094EA3|nr:MULTISPECIES: hypothetical protein [unclassified Oceanispirochaeta]MBF9018750.1 hypothetical protein [Oceanispirochaeta sp. M2]NPD75188.1 hypothetical protein [Oceanispirochaeta sp. M1]RDG28971.1 hypothetical protein DV872_24135 [Oceanispirochaeta sp. M1]
MIRFYSSFNNEHFRSLVSIRESLQFREKIKVLRPTGNSLLSPGVIKLGHEITGTITFRLNRDTLPSLLFLITGLVSASDHLGQSHGLFFHDLESSPRAAKPLSLIQKIGESLYILEDLELLEFKLAGCRREAVYLTLHLLGTQPRIFSFGKEGAPSVPDQGFLKLEGDEIKANEIPLPDLAAFSLSGKFSDSRKIHELMIRRKDQITTDYSLMRQRLSFQMILCSRDSYEPDQRVRCEITIDQAIYRGEESFPDNKGIWGREFRYTIIGPVKIRVFTHLDLEGSTL